MAFDDEVSPYADSVFQAFGDDSAIVPEIWVLAVANALLVAERKGRITPKQSSEILLDLEPLQITVVSASQGSSFKRTLPLAREHGLTAYDASDLQLALVEHAPLATSGDRLRKAAVTAGVAIFQRGVEV
jgi:predicted nucleic acid-binding protein